MKRSLFAALVVDVVLLILGRTACVKEVEAMEPTILSIALWQDADSARFVVKWTGPYRHPALYPIGIYYVRIVNTETGDTVGASAVAAPNHEDTVAVAWPAPGDTIPVQAMVRALDVNGQMGPWGRSPIVLFGVGVIPPSAPDSVMLIPLDTIPWAMQIRSIEVRPAFIHLYYVETPDSAWGTSEQACAMITYNNGKTGYGCGTCGVPAQTYCGEVYRRWLREVDA